jgi:hypothetical protein
MAICVAPFLLPNLLCGQVAEQTATSVREITATEVDSLLVVLRDEIYDHGYQKGFWGFETSGPRGPEARYNIFIQPKLTPTTGGVTGAVIYRYLPFGEVYRHFIIASKGEIVLMGDPDTGFPWTQPNTRTIYMNDEDVCKAKHEWHKTTFEFDLEPSSTELRSAAERQKERTGFSYWLSRSRRK